MLEAARAELQPTPDRPSFEASQQATHETGDIGSERVVALAKKKRRSSSRTDGVERGEVLPQYLHRLLCIGVVQQRPQTRSDILHSSSEVAKNVPEIVRVLVLSAVPEGQSFQDHERTHATNRDVTRNGLVSKRPAGDSNLLTITKGQQQTRRNDRGEIAFKVLQRPCCCSSSSGNGRHQEIDRRAARGVPPALSRHVSFFVPVR